MIKKEKPTIESMWQEFVEDSDLGEYGISDYLQAKLKFIFCSGIHSMLHVGDNAQNTCEDPDDFIQLLRDLHMQCIELDTGSEPDGKPKKPNLKIIH